MKYIFLIILFIITPAFATDLAPKSLGELVSISDHIIEVQITKIDMINSEGTLVTDREALTGPGRANEIRLHARVISVLRTNKLKVPEQLTVSLWRLWNYSLKEVSDISLNKREIFLLEGNDFLPVYPGLFRRSINERDKIRILLDKEQLHKQFSP